MHTLDSEGSRTKDKAKKTMPTIVTKETLMDSVKTELLIAGVMVKVEVFDDKILFLDDDGKYEQRLDVLANLKDK